MILPRFRRLAILSAICIAVPAAEMRVDTRRVDALVESARSRLKIPGVAVGILTRDGVYLKGYGVRKLGATQPVTEHTAFDVGSVTKSVTATGAALMVDDGKLEWDRPVREYIEWFRMADPAATAGLTMRDLLTHRSGLPGYNFLRFAVPLPREEIVWRLRFLEPTAPLRARYQYQNLMYTTAGFLAGVVNGTSWEELTEKRIFAPLGMRDSTTRAADLVKTADFASPHEKVDGVMRVVPFYDYQHFGVGPNGSVNSSASDLLRYLRFHMGDGTFEGKRILSERQLAELHHPQMVVDEVSSYALGWNVNWSPGFKVVSHGGSITGFNAYAAFAADRGEAFVVLANTSGVATPIANSLMSEVLGWKLAKARALPRIAVSAKATSSGPLSLPIDAYAGRYTHPAFGPCDVALNNGSLEVRFPERSFRLRHLRLDVFEATESEVNTKSEARFLPGRGGKPEAVELLLEDAAPPLRFRRIQ